MEIDKQWLETVQESDDVCALPLVRRLAATLDRDPGQFRDGDPLPRGWHLAFFSVDTRQSQLRADGVAGFGVPLPDLGLPRVVFGGRRIRFDGDIRIGARLRRVSRLLSITPKEGRSGRFAVATVQHEIYADGAAHPAVIDQQDQVMREAAAGEEPSRPAPPAAAAAMPQPARRRVVVPDETLLFRISAIMFNPHRIHYDLPYAVGQEGYPGLVVNASVSSLLLLEFFRDEAARAPSSIQLRNAGVAFSGRPLRLNAAPAEGPWRLWADTAEGQLVTEGTMQ